MKTFTRVLALLLSVLPFLSSEVSAAKKKQGLALKIGKGAISGFHLPQWMIGKVMYARPSSNEHDVFYMEDLASVAGVEPKFLMLESDDIQNAHAVYDGELRMIVYDPKWLRGTVRSRNNVEGSVIAHFWLGHELGHHVCNHHGAKRNPWAQELEADQFSGAVLRKASVQESAYLSGLSYQVMLTAVATVLSSPASATHPAGSDRLEAVARGWNQGTSCGTR